MKKALVLLFDKVEELEAIAPIDIMRRANVEVVTASLDGDINVVGRSGINIECEALFDDVYDKPFDLILLPGGSGVYDWLKYAPLLNVLKLQYSRGDFIAAICAAPLVLKEAGLLENISNTAHASVVDKLPNCKPLERVVCDKNIITSRGAGTAIEFGLKIVEKLVDEKTSKDVAKSIGFVD